MPENTPFYAYTLRFVIQTAMVKMALGTNKIAMQTKRKAVHSEARFLQAK